MRIRNVLITGASSGIGKAVKEKLTEEGHLVWGVSRTGDYQIDLREVDQIGRKMEQILRKHPEIDTVICNAGKGRFGSLEEFSYGQMKEMIDVNFLSHAMITRALLPHLKQKEEADLMFMGSEAALQGKKKGSLYCASKFALRGFAQALREECANTSVRVSMIQPGMVRTPFFLDLGFEANENALEAEDIAQLVSWILQQPHRIVFDEIALSPLKKSYRKKDSLTKL